MASSWYADPQHLVERQHHQYQNSDGSSSRSSFARGGAASSASASMQESSGAHWNSNTMGYQQHAGQGYASPSASSSTSNLQQHTFQQQQPVLHKRPSTSQMQGVTYHGTGSSVNSQPPPASPGYPSQSMMSPIPPGSSAGHAMQQQQQRPGSMVLSPGLRSNPQANAGSQFAYDQSRMPPSSFSPVLPSGQQYYAGSSNPGSGSNNARNHGLGVSASNHYAPGSTGPSSPFNVGDQRQQQHLTRPTNLAASSGGSYGNNNHNNASTSSNHPQRQFNRSNSSASAALSISTSPTTTGQASPMTPSSPAALSTSTARGGMPVLQQQQQLQQQHQQQYSYNTNNSHNSISSPLDQQQQFNAAGSRPSLQQAPSSFSNYANTSQTPDQAHAQAQYAAYLEDPMSGLDRRIGSYSPSHYAVGGAGALPGGGGGPPSTSGQFAPSPYQQMPATLPSPRHAQSNAYFSPASASSNNPIPLPQTMQQQQHRQSTSLSPSYSRQGQPIASTSMTHAPSNSTTSSTPYSPALHQHQTSLSSSSSAGAPNSMKQYHNRSGSYSSPQTTTQNERTLIRQRPRSTGSAFRQVRTAADLAPKQQGSEQGSRRADPDGGVVSPLKALTTQLSQTYHLVNPNFRYEFSLNPRRVLTKPSKPCGNNGYDNEDSDYILYVNDVLGSEGNKYLILDVLGQGTFGQVVKCQNLKTHEIVGVKVIKNKEAYAQQSTMEIMILDILNGTYDPEDKHHILRLKDSFTHQKHLCLVFELLSSNLYELIKQNSFRGLSLSLVRVFTEQLLDALCVLKEAKLIHCDLKPENILLKTLQSPDIKVIDFGSACHEKQTVYTYIQSRFYRSPEVLLGLPYSTSIDMWSLGCICVELFLGLPLFPGTSEFNQITRIVEMLGLPPTYMLESGKQVHNFFNFYYDNYGQKRWQLKTMEEYQREHPNAKEQPSKKFFNATTLPEIIKQYPNQRKNLSPTDLERESQNRLSFIDFVTGLLNMNPLERWTPQQAKLHPFVQNKEFLGPFVPHQNQMQGYNNNNADAMSPRPKDVAQERPYGGLPPTPARTSTQTYHDAAQYQQHLSAQQAHNAMASANAYRQSQYTSNNPYALPSSSLPEQQPSRRQSQNEGYHVPKLPPISVTAPRASGSSQHSPSQSMNVPSSSRMSTGNPLSPNIPMNPPQAHHYPVRGRSGTFSQLDVPPALQKLGIDLSSFKAIGTPKLHRDEQRAAWERRNTGNSELDRRRSLKQSNPHLEHLEYYAQTQPGNYYYPSAPMQQPFSVVVDPRMADAAQRQHHQAASSVTVPPQAYGGQGGMRYAQQPQQPQLVPGLQQPHSAGPYDSFDQFDARDGLNAMMHQPLLPTQATANHYYGQGHNQQQMFGIPYAGSSDTTAGSVDMGLSPPGGKQKRSDQQMWP